MGLWNEVASAFDVGSTKLANGLFGESPSAKNQVAQAHAAQARLVQDPKTGLWIDPQTGQVYKSQSPFNSVGDVIDQVSPTDPRVAQTKTDIGNGGGKVATRPVSQITPYGGNRGAGPGGPIQTHFLTKDPATGHYIDPKTGNQFLDPMGTQPIAPQNLGTLETNAFETGKGLTTGAQSQLDTFNRAMSGEMSLGDALNETIKNVNAPSVAAEQERQALEANQNAQLAAASGASGENGALARREAANNTAALGAQDAQTAALRRAQEVAAAQGELGNVLGTVGSQSSNVYGQNMNLGLGYTNLAHGDVTTALNQQQQTRTTPPWTTSLLGPVATGLGSAGGAALTSFLKPSGSDNSPTGSGTDTSGGSTGIDPNTGGVTLGPNQSYGPPAPTGDGSGSTAGPITDTSGGGTSDALGISNPGIQNRDFLTSDKRAKKNIRAESPSAEESFMSALHGKGFQYDEDPDEEPERHGILTEDLKRSQIGSSIVKKSPSGFEGVDVAQGLGAALSALGYLHKRLTKIEGEHGDG